MTVKNTRWQRARTAGDGSSLDVHDDRGGDIVKSQVRDNGPATP